MHNRKGWSEIAFPVDVGWGCFKIGHAEVFNGTNLQGLLLKRPLLCPKADTNPSSQAMWYMDNFGREAVHFCTTQKVHRIHQWLHYTNNVLWLLFICSSRYIPVGGHCSWTWVIDFPGLAEVLSAISNYSMFPMWDFQCINIWTARLGKHGTHTMTHDSSGPLNKEYQPLPERSVYPGRRHRPPNELWLVHARSFWWPIQSYGQWVDSI